MSLENGCPEPTCKTGETIDGFSIERVTEVPEIRATAYEAVHSVTGAKVLHLHCDDRENLYSITFRTPPTDSTGVAHILEHSVLAGSRKYPVKDAFNELAKSSLKTFLNAFTAPDFTSYPVASQVRADFYNLASVYTDLVFRPLLAPNTFMQEGHHLEVGPDGELVLSGIVYNEMKGAFSTPESVAERTTLQALFPDTPYGVESGGHPDHIPDLTYQAFREFHRRYYSPGNARIFLYGNLPTRTHLRFLAGQMAGFERVEVDSAVNDQPRWTAPRVAGDSFPIGPDDSPDRRTQVDVAWLTAGVDDLEERLVLQVLEEALVGNAGAPLRKALVESGLGEDLSPTTGLATWYRQLPFVVGLRGTDPDRAEPIENLILSTLRGIADRGLPAELLEAAFHQVEFKGLEITRTPHGFHVALLLKCLGTWLHDHDPLVPLRFPTLIDGLRRRWEKQADLFARAVRRWLVDNPHRVRSVVTPSRTLAAESDARVRERLALAREKLDAAGLAEIARTAEALHAAQRSPDSPEALATLPRLSLSEIPSDVQTIPCLERSIDAVPVLEHDLFTNGIAYLDMAFDISDVPEDLQPYLPLLAAASCEMGAAGDDYAAFATRKALHTGGVSLELRAREHLAGGSTVQVAILRAKALARKQDRMFDVVKDLLTAGDLTDRTRLGDVLSELRNGLRASVAPRGHQFSSRTAASSLSLAAHRDEQWHGASQVRFLDGLTRRFEADSSTIIDSLTRLRQMVFRRARVIVNITGDERCLTSLRTSVTGLVAALPAGGQPGPESRPEMSGADVGVSIPGNVCYVARVLPAPRFTDPLAPAVMVFSNHLGDGLLYRQIRLEGGAYGGLSSYNPSTGLFALLSYRDPHLERTLSVYDRCLAEFLAEPLDRDDVEKAIIGTVAAIDSPMDPATRGLVSLERRLAGLTDADRLKFKQEVLATTADRMREGARRVLAAAGGRQSVFAPRERIEAANKALPRPFDIVGLDQAQQAPTARRSGPA